MTEKLVWQCDGCGNERVMGESNNGDWRRITVTLGGFAGYPCGHEADGTRCYELCPRCQIRLDDAASPARWPREAKPEAA